MSDINQGPILSASSTSGLADNVAGALAYITVIPAILFLVLEPYNRNPFIRFHSFQSIALTVCAIVVSVFAVVPIIGWILGPILMLVLFVAWVICIWQAFQGKVFRLPLLGSLVDSMAK